MRQEGRSLIGPGRRSAVWTPVPWSSARSAVVKCGSALDVRGPSGQACGEEALLTPHLSLLPLSEVRPADAARVGGKALPLARLAADGLPVPPGFVVPTDAFEAAVEAAGLGRLAATVAAEGEGPAAQALRAALEAVPLPDGWESALVAAARALGGPVAVRSSGVDEDGARRSFAGQHDTVLGVAAEDVPAAVRRCWASMVAERALAYRGGHGPAPGSLAVLVQRMVPAARSGVLFTVDPVSGSWREMTIEAVWGLPEALVAGRVAPHWFRLRRPRRTPRPIQRVLARVRITPLDSDLPEIPQRWTLADDGSVRVGAVPERLRGLAVLTPSDARRIGRLGLRIEARLGAPQDIEWAMTDDGRVWILQARPITASGPAASDGVLWTRRFIGERLPDPVTPLGWSVVGPILEHFIAYPEVQRELLGGGPALRLLHGRPYVNATAFARLVFKLPGGAPPAFMLELLPTDEVDRVRRRFAVAPDFAVYAAFLRVTLEERRWRRFAWNPLTNPATWRAFEAELHEALGRAAPAPTSERAAVERVEALIGLARRYVGIHVCSLLFASLCDQLFEGVLASAAPERASALRAALAVAPEGNRTLEVNAALWRLARALSAEDVAAIAEGVAPSPPGRAALDGFLARYGHRAAVSWDVGAPRWREEPARLGPLLRAQRGEAVDPERRAAEQALQAEAARAELLAALPDPAWRALVVRLLDLLRDYLLLRENQRFAFELLQWELKRAALWLGARLAARGALPDAEAAVWCTWPELRAAVEGGAPDDLVARVASRRAAFARDLERDAPIFLRGDEVLGPPPGASRLQGVGVSPGRARGVVRRVRSLAEASSVLPGDILVAPGVDPGWTPLLGIVGGLVLELGSRLSHGAVIAREYRVPAVVNVEGAMTRLVDGAEVTLDGTRGLVFVHQ